MGGFFDEVFDAAAGPDVVKHLHNGQWRSTGRDTYTSVANPSKGGTAFRVQGACPNARQAAALAQSAAQSVCLPVRLSVLVVQCHCPLLASPSHARAACRLHRG